MKTFLHAYAVTYFDWGYIVVAAFIGPAIGWTQPWKRCAVAMLAMLLFGLLMIFLKHSLS